MKTKQKIVRIKEIYKINDFKIFCHFSNDEYRYINFKKLFKTWNVKRGDTEYLLLDKNELQKVKLSNGTLSWECVSVSLIDENNQEQQYPYEIDPIVLYQNSIFDEDKIFDDIGMLLRNERKKSGLTRKQLAKKSGISEEYITKLEDEKTNIELIMLKDILNKGFGKKLQINVE